jgi:glycosyltransferase involved in cell wall biosynthesis
VAAVKSEPLVSVIMIFYQAERFMREAIESVLGQTWAAWELLLVDDGSTDEGTDIALRYAREHPDRIRYLEHPGHANRGMAASRKHGMAAARGKYVAFLDADDVFMPERLRAHVSIIERMPAPSVVIGSELYWYSWDEGADPRLGQRDFVPTIGTTPNVVFQPPDLLTLLVRSSATPGICSITFHRLDADGLEGAPDTFTGLLEDQCLVAILLAHRPAHVTDQCLAKYRLHAKSSTGLARRRGEIESRRPGSAEHRYLDWLQQYLIEHEVSSPHLDSALRARRIPYDFPLVGSFSSALTTIAVVARTSLVRGLRALIDDRNFDGLRRIREGRKRARSQRRERRIRKEAGR